MIKDTQNDEIIQNNTEANKSLNINQSEGKTIKFYPFDNGIYYLFIKNKNEIKIISCTELSDIFTLYHNYLIQDFIITSKTYSLILCSSTDLSIYNLPSKSDNKNLEIKYIFSKSVKVDGIRHLSSSILNDIIITINKLYVIKIFDMNLNNIKTFSVEKWYLSNNLGILPLDVFDLSFDTKTILISKYGHNQFFFVYKEIYDSGDEEFKIKNILINEKIICLREYEQNFGIYLNYKNSSVIFILTEELSFLIVQKVFEDNFGNNFQNNYVPNIRNLLYIDLMNFTKINFDSLSFSLMNQYKNHKYDCFGAKDLKSWIIDSESWSNNNTDINSDQIDNYFNLGDKYLKDRNYDYLIFNFKEKIIIFKIEGLKSSHFINPSLSDHYIVYVDKNYQNCYTILNFIKYFDNNYSLFFLDKFKNIKKFNLNLIDKEKTENDSKTNVKICVNNRYNSNNNEINNIKELNNIKEKKSKGIVLHISNNNIKENNVLQPIAKIDREKYNTENTLKSNSITNNLNKKKFINFEKKRDSSFNNINSKSTELEKDKEKDTQKKEVQKNIFIKFSSMYPLYKNIIYAEYNNHNKMTFIYQKIGPNSVVSLLDSNSSLIKIIVFESIEVFNIIWIKNTNFIMFYYVKKNIQNKKDMPILVIFNVHSKYLNQRENIVNDNKIKNVFIYVNISLFFKLNININKIFIQSNLESLNVENILKNNNNDKNKIQNQININKQSDKNNSNNKVNTDISKSNKIQNNSSSSFSFSFLILLKTDFTLYNLLIRITRGDKIKEYDYELKNNFSIKQKSLLLSKYDIDNWKNKEFIFNSNEIFYTSYNDSFDFIKIIKTDKNLVNKTIFESIYLDKISNIYYYNNNYIIYINAIYINIYDIKNREFYRISNEHINIKEDKIIFNNYFNHLFMIVISSKSFKIINLLSSYDNINIIKNEFKYIFYFGEFNMINLFNNSLYINGSQIISNFNEVILNKNPMINYNNFFHLIKLLSFNTCSIFDKELFLVNYLNNNENENKLLINILFDKYNKSKQEKSIYHSFQNNKTIPNIFDNIDMITKLLTLEYNNNLKNDKNNNLNLNNIKFNKEVDSSKLKQFHDFLNKNQNLSFINYLYDLISNEKTKKYDNITKYFMLKYNKLTLDENFKISTSDLCWLSLMNNQTDILNFICQGNISNMTWETMTKYNIPLWINSDIKLRELLVEVGKNKYKQDLVNKHKNNLNKIELNNFTENVALYFYLSGNNNLLYNYYDKEAHNEKIKKFIMKDFSIKKNRKAAHQNADALFNKKKFIYAAFFYLLADDVRSALDMVYEKMNDINLTVCILKLVKNKYGENNFSKYYSINKMYDELFINFGILFRDPYLVTFGYIGQEKYDLALEYILHYNSEYNLNEMKDMFKDYDEFNSYLNLLKKTFSFSVFDYKIILFAKNLEKIYQIKYEESNKNVKNLVNTDFNENDWDMDALNQSDSNRSEDNHNETPIKNNNCNKNENNYKMKKINCDYNNLLLLCIKNYINCGNVFTAIINTVNKNSKLGIKNMPALLKNKLKNILNERIILDSMHITSSYNINKNYNKYGIELNKFLDYIQKQGFINNKLEVYYNINETFLLFNLYNNLNISPKNIFNSKQKLKIIKSIESYLETLINNIINDLISFSSYQINNLIKIEDILFKYNYILSFIMRLEKDNKNYEFNAYTIYILRIIFGCFCYLIYVCKIFLKCNKISFLFEIIQKLNNEFDDITKIKNEKIIEIIDILNNNIIKLLNRIKKIKSGEIKINFESGLILYLFFINLSINKELLNLFEEQNIKKINLMKQNGNKNIANDIDNFYYFINLKQKINTDMNTFDFYIKKYIEDSLDSSLAFAIYEELKNIYINKKNINFISDVRNNSKIIKYEKVFHSKDKTKFFDKFFKFEKLFKLGGIIRNKLFILSMNFKYEKINENSSQENQINISDSSLPPSYITSKSIQIVNNIFKNGYDICNFNNEIKVKDFCFNQCDITQMSVSLQEKGNIKINALDTLLNKVGKIKKPIELDSHIHWEKSYEASLNKDYNQLFNFKLKQNNFNDILPILYQNIIIPKNKSKYNNINSFFPEKLLLPPKYYNNAPSTSYLNEISLYRPKSSSILYSDILESHPQLPVYLSSNSNGILFLYPFNQENKKSTIIDEFYVDKTESSTNIYMKNIKFNSYGDNFMACDTEGNLYNWSFDHIQSRKMPQNIIHNNSEKREYFFCNDMCYLNSTGMIATISKNNITIFDFLMPVRSRKVNEAYFGGEILLPFFSNSSFIISNNDSPGKISFVDIRKMEIIKQVQLYNSINSENKNVNNIKIMDMKLSEKENYLITYGSDYTVKIWDLSEKNNALLVESLKPFNVENKEKISDEGNFRGKLKLSSGYLFVSKCNNIKLLRENII